MFRSRRILFKKRIAVASLPRHYFLMSESIFHYRSIWSTCRHQIDLRKTASCYIPSVASKKPRSDWIIKVKGQLHSFAAVGLVDITRSHRSQQPRSASRNLFYCLYPAYLACTPSPDISISPANFWFLRSPPLATFYLLSFPPLPLVNYTGSPLLIWKNKALSSIHGWRVERRKDNNK